MRSYSYTLKELLELLLKSHNIHDGYWDLGITFEGRGAAITYAPDEFPTPSLVLRVAKITLSEKPEATAGTIDASEFKEPSQPRPKVARRMAVQLAMPSEEKSPPS
ncbi:MAG: hypothetical protein HY675_03390 [Chloroflexi bacterium]|nr:hypothetical protein [Chloroflexota bacterium]